MNSDPHDGTAVKDLLQLVERYVAVWNEPDPDVRRTVIRELWAPDGAQVLNQVMFCGDEARGTDADLARYADAAVRTFLAAYGTS